MSVSKTPETGARRSAFTLIELLVAMFILVVLVLITTRIFQQSTAMWDIGTRRAEMDLVGRAVAGFIVQEVSQAVTDQAANVTFTIATNTVAFAILAEPRGGRTVQGIQYAFQDHMITREVRDAVGANAGGYIWGGWQPAQVVATNVMGMAFYTSGEAFPRFVDVRLIIGNPDDMRRGLGNEQTYEARAWLQNQKR